MRPRPVHRWTGGLLGRHRIAGDDLALPADPWLPRLRRCDCRWVLGLRVGDLAGCESLQRGQLEGNPTVDADTVVWTPAWVLAAAYRDAW